MAFRIQIEGSRAVFPRPGFVRDHVSYDIITPRAARAILEAVHWRPAIRWIVESIHVLNPPELVIVPPVGNYPTTVALENVAYLVAARFEMVPGASHDHPSQHAAMFRRRAAQGRFHREPYLGRPDCPARIRLLTEDEAAPIAVATESRVDWGWMLHDVAEDGRARYFRAVGLDGVVDVPPVSSEHLRA